MWVTSDLMAALERKRKAPVINCCLGFKYFTWETCVIQKIALMLLGPASTHASCSSSPSSSSISFSSFLLLPLFLLLFHHLLFFSSIRLYLLRFSRMICLMKNNLNAFCPGEKKEFRVFVIEKSYSIFTNLARGHSVFGFGTSVSALHVCAGKQVTPLH